jgi:microcystin-dependent protein
MSDQFLGEIRMFGGNFAPQGWALCDGQLLGIQQNLALFSVLGTAFGGNGTLNFGLPNLQGKFPLDYGQGQGLSPYGMGETGGYTQVVLSTGQLPQHSHQVIVSNSPADSRSPQGNVLAVSDHYIYATGVPSSTVNLSAAAVTQTGGSEPHNNVQPFIVLNFIISLTGIFPSRS